MKSSFEIRFHFCLDEFNKRTLTEYRNNILDLRQQNHAMGVSMEKQKAFYKWKISTIKQELINEVRLDAVSNTFSFFLKMAFLIIIVIVFLELRCHFDTWFLYQLLAFCCRAVFSR